jgi:hypothetical protein
MSSPISQIPSSPPRESAAEKTVATRPSYKLSKDEVSKQVSELHRAVRQLVKILLLTADGKPLKNAAGESITKEQVRTWVSQINRHFDNHRKVINASVSKSVASSAKSKRDGSQLKGVGFISDSFVEFFRNANKGNGLAGLLTGTVAPTPALASVWKNLLQSKGYQMTDLASLCLANGFDPATRRSTSEFLGIIEFSVEKIAEGFGMPGFSLDSVNVDNAMEEIIYRRGIAASPFLASCLHLIAKVNRLASQSNGQRVHYDQVWLDSFGQGNTHYVVGGRDLTEELRAAVSRMNSGDVNAYLSSIAGSSGKTNSDRVAKLLDHLANADKTGFQRLAESASRGPATTKAGKPRVVPFIAREDAVPGTDDWGISHQSFMTLLSYYRVPDYVLPGDLRAQISPDTDLGQENSDLNKSLWDYIHSLSLAHHLVSPPKKRAKPSKKAAAAAAAPSTSFPPPPRVSGGVPRPASPPRGMPVPSSPLPGLGLPRPVSPLRASTLFPGVRPPSPPPLRMGAAPLSSVFPPAPGQ